MRVQTHRVQILASVLFATLLWSTENQAASEAGQWAFYSDTRLAEIAAGGSDAPRQDIHLATGLLHFWSDDRESAVAEFKQALVFDPDSAPAHVFLAMALNWQAILFPVHMDATADIPPSSPSEEIQADLIATADWHFDRATSLDPDDPYLWTSLANALFDRSRNNPLLIPTRDPSPIFAAYQRAREADADYPPARRGLAEALYSYALAYRAVFSRHPKPGTIGEWLPDDLDGQANAYLAEATVHYDWLIERRPDDESLYRHAIEALGALHQFDEAIALCKQAIDRFPDTRTGRAAHRLWGEMLALPDFPSGGSMESRHAEHAAYGSRLAR